MRDVPIEVAPRSRARILGCPIDLATMDETVELILQLIRSNSQSSQLSLNAAKVVEAQRDATVRGFLDRATIVSADGQSLVWAGRLLGVPIRERVAGIDLLVALLAAFEKEHISPFFLGAREDVLERAIERIAARHPGLRIAGQHHGHFPPEEDAAIAKLIGAARPDVLFVAMSSPRKEYWIDSFQDACGAVFAMGVGGSLDVLAGVTRRAPASMRRLGLEWAFRTAQEPRRLAGRYVRTNGLFLRLVVADLARRSRERRSSANRRR